MRCVVCDTRLETGELTKKTPDGEFLDTCKNCMAKVYQTESEFDFMSDIVGLKTIVDKSVDNE